jgi:hypothetical protein
MSPVLGTSIERRELGKKRPLKNSFEQPQIELEKLESVVSFVVSFNPKTTETIDK